MTKEQLAKRESEKRADLIAKQKQRIQQKIDERTQGIQKQYDGLVNDQIQKLREKYARKMQRRINKVTKEIKEKQTDAIREIRGQEKKERIPKNMKQKAYMEVQKYAKLLRADRNGIVTQIDTGKRVHWSECVGGHIYSKKNVPQLAFEVSNIWPISSRENERQRENIGDWIDKTPLTIEEKKILSDIANDGQRKSQLRDGNYYRKQYERYKALNQEQEKRLALRV